MNRPTHPIPGGIAVALVIAVMTACGEESEVDTGPSAGIPIPPPVAAPPPQQPPPTFPAVNFQVAGEVFVLGQGPAAGAQLHIWVSLNSGGGYSYYWATGSLPVSDVQGRWMTGFVPPAQLMIMASHPGSVQPCALIVATNTTEPVRLELIPSEAFASSEPPRPPMARDPSLTGMVYEVTPEGRKPVTGANIWIETGFEVAVAATLTSRDGRYYVCNLPPEVALHATKPGYVTSSTYGIDTSTGIPVDIELRPGGPWDY